MFILLGCAGCASEAIVDEPIRQGMEDFREFLKYLPTDGKKPPRKLSEFIPLEPIAPVAAEYVINGQLVYVWGSDLVEGGNRIVAYEKGVETNGGWVLIENGEVKKMTAEEFKSSSKAEISTK